MYLLSIFMHMHEVITYKSVYITCEAMTNASYKDNSIYKVKSCNSVSMELL